MENDNLNLSSQSQDNIKHENPIPRFEDSKDDVAQNEVAQKFSQYKTEGSTSKVVIPPKVSQVQVTKYENVKPAYVAVEQQRAMNSSIGGASYFDGKMLDLWGLRVLQIFIEVLTLGLASPWIVCIVQRYKCKHTHFNGKTLKFEGDPVDLFLLTFRWNILTLLTLGIYAFFVPPKKASWIASNTHFEDEPLVKGDSYFTGSIAGYIGVNLLCCILTTISFGLLFPFAECYKMRWICSNSVINKKRIEFTGRAGSLFVNYIKWFFFSAITCGIYGLWMEVNVISWKVKNIRITSIADGRRDEKEKGSGAVIGIIVGAVVLAIVGFVVVPLIVNLVSKGDFPDLFGKKSSHELARNEVQYEIAQDEVR